MVPHTSRDRHFAATIRQADLLASVERVLPCAIMQIETTALYMSLSLLWGLVFFYVITNAL